MEYTANKKIPQWSPGDFLLFDFADFLEAFLAGSDVTDVFSAGLKLTDKFKLIDHWREDRINAFNAHAFGDLADRHGFAFGSATDVQDKAFKDLNTFFFLAFGVHVLNFLVDADLHTGANGFRCKGGEFLGFGHMWAKNTRE